jgi:hypothetical protein
MKIGIYKQKITDMNRIFFKREKVTEKRYKTALTVVLYVLALCVSFFFDFSTAFLLFVCSVIVAGFCFYKQKHDLSLTTASAISSIDLNTFLWKGKNKYRSLQYTIHSNIWKTDFG